jgi:hypothetical protein
LFLSFIQVNVLRPEFPFHPNPKARGRQATWLCFGYTLEVLIMTYEQRGHSFQHTEFREIQTKQVILTPELLLFSKYSLSLLNRNLVFHTVLVFEGVFTDFILIHGGLYASRFHFNIILPLRL